MPAREPQRFAALRACDILDSAEEEIYDQITAAAAEACQAPISLLSFVDQDREWCKSHYGVGWNATSRDISFCAHAICSDEEFVVENTLHEERFRDNPLVTGTHGIRFYAGIPLRTSDGFNLGALCILDTVPRKITTQELEILRVLRDSAIQMIVLRRQHGSSLFSAAINLTTDAVAIADMTSPGYPIFYANRSFLALTGRKYYEVIGLPLHYPCNHEVAQRLEQALEHRRPETVECELKLADRHVRDRITIIPCVNGEGDLIHTVAVHRDVTLEREIEVQRQQLHAMRTTMRTVNHIVFNFMNAAWLLRQEMKDQLGSRALQQFDAVMQNTRAQLTNIGKMPDFRERPTPFGALLDPDEED